MTTGIPTFTDEENRYYDDLVTKYASKISVPDVIHHKWLCNDERNRLLWYFISEMIRKDETILDLFRKNIDRWENDPDKQDYWVEKWTEILDKVDQGQLEILYEQNELMQQLRSHAPSKGLEMDEKLRWKIISYINSLYYRPKANDKHNNER